MEWFKEWFDENYLELFLKPQNEELTKRQVDFIIDVLNLNRGDRVLDVGCGIGRHLIELAKRGIKGVGIDIVDRFIEIAKENKKDLDIEFLKMDERNMNFSEEFDGVISMWTSFGYFSDDENLSVLKRIQKALKPNKRFLLDIENVYYLIKNLVRERWERKGNIFLLERNKFSIMNGRIKTKRIIIKEGKVFEYERIYRIFTKTEIEEYLSLSGFKIINVFGGYTKEPLKENSKRLIVLAEKT
ncbi:MAG: class I SAM-dependent methyltransferase [Caldisericia bacterium]|nr:class I SAM-dependent methyltransferase [Caldisericia bacterium]